MTPPVTSFPVVEKKIAKPLLQPARPHVCVPKHLAVAADFDARDANAAIESLSTLISECLDNNIACLSVMVSTEGADPVWLKAIAEYVEANSDSLVARGVRIEVLTTRSDKNESEISREINRVPKPHAADERLSLKLLLKYNGREEIVNGLRRIATEVQAGRAPRDSKFLAKQLMDLDVPPVDLLIHTGGRTSLCDLLLWHSAYAELLFVKRSWSDFGRADFNSAMQDYARRSRTFGALPSK